MSLFAWLFGSRGPKNVDARPDSIWQSRTAKLNGIRRDIEHAERSDAVAILPVAHVPATIGKLNSLVESMEQWFEKNVPKH